MDNAWDADSENVWISLPERSIANLEITVLDTIVIKDDGTGMTEPEVRQEYLKIASSRTKRKGDKTASKNRNVKGRKGVGKFSGFVLADEMRLETIPMTGKQKTTVTINRKDLIESEGDLEKINLPITISEVNGKQGTTVTLSLLNQLLTYPNVETVKEILILEYGREKDFAIHVNEKLIGQEDFPGQYREAEIELPDVGKVKLKLTILEKPTSKHRAGIVIRVRGKIVGPPQYFGLEDDPGVTKKILQRIVGEIEADGLDEASAITADWGGFIENNIAFQSVRDEIVKFTTPIIKEVCKSDYQMAMARHQRLINLRMAQLPEHRRSFAKLALDKLLRDFYYEKEDRLEVLINLLLDSIERDEYFTVCKEIESAATKDIASLADALKDFGLTDIAIVGRQASRRIQFLDSLGKLADDNKTIEQVMHKACEHNLWVIGENYSLYSSNKTLKSIIDEVTNQKSKGKGSTNRPDLFLGQNPYEKKLLIEFKRPSATIGRDAEYQAKKYRDTLEPDCGEMDILIIGGKVTPKMSKAHPNPDVKFMTYKDIISSARNRLEWLVKGLKEGDTNT